MIEFRFPSLGADMDSGRLVGWLIAPGDVVHRGDIVAEVETDKGLVEIETWADGRVTQLLVEPSDDQIPVGTPLAIFEALEDDTAEAAPPVPTPDGGTSPQPSLPPPSRMHVPPPPPPAPMTPPVRHLAHQLGVDPSSITPRSDGTITREDVARQAERLGSGSKVSPLARRTATDLGVDLAQVESSRPDGLITADDVRAAAGTTPTQPDPTTSTQAEADSDAGADNRMAAMRHAISRSMSRSKREIPHYYLSTRIDLDAALRWLDRENEQRPLAQRLLPAALLLRATALALREVPELNGHWIDDEFRPGEAVHLGVAISLREGGLVAPGILDAEKLGLDETMVALRDLVTRARTWRIRSSEMSAPTMTVTNLGDRGVETVFPVIIPPQVAMVGFGKIVEEPVAVEGMLGIRPVVQATLAGDHRVTDGHRGGTLLSSIDRLLQEPQKL